MNRVIKTSPSLRRRRGAPAMAFAVLLLGFAVTDSSWAQTVSGVRAFGGGVAPLFNLVGSPGFYYTDNQGTQGSMYTFGSFESYSYLTPGGQAWSGAVMTFGPQLSIGLVQGVNQTGTPTVFVPPPRQLPPLPPAPEVDALTLDLIP